MLAAPPKARVDVLAPPAVEDLLSIPAEELHRVDIARMNLLCATGLPDTPDLDVEALLKQLDAMSKLCRIRTHALRDLRTTHANLFEDSDPLWRAYCVARVLRLDFKIHYCEEELDRTKDADWRISSRHLIHGLLGPERHGTCASLPVLMVAVGRRLGYPMRLVHSPGHLFCRWDDVDGQNPAWRERRNFEFTGGFDTSPDEHYYESPVPWDRETLEAERNRERPLFLRSLDPHEELAMFLLQRGHALEAHQFYEQARLTYGIAAHLVPDHPVYVWNARRCHRIQIDQALGKWGLTAYEYGVLTRLRYGGEKFLFPWEIRERVPELEHLSSALTLEAIRALRELEYSTVMRFRRQGIRPGMLPYPLAPCPTDSLILSRMRQVPCLSGSAACSVSSPNSLVLSATNPPGVLPCMNPPPDVLKASIPTPVIVSIPRVSINISTRTRIR